MRKLLFLVFVAALLLPMVPQPVAGQTKLARLMEEKLKYAKLVLEGVAVGDFDKVANNSERLVQLTRTEEWFVLKTPKYELHSLEFRRAAENLIQKAKAKNQDGMNFGYVELSMACFRCHQYVREVRDARLTIPSDFNLTRRP